MNDDLATRGGVDFAEVETEIRDLTENIKELQQFQQEREVIVQDVSKKTPKVRIYSMVNGEPFDVPVHMARDMLRERLPNGNMAFTGKADQAPEYKLGDIKCFLHADSEERQYLDGLGLGLIECRKKTLASNYSKRIHEQHRHPQQRAMLDEHLEKIRDDEWRDEQREEREERRKTTDAMLKLAGAAPKRGKKAGDASDD